MTVYNTNLTGGGPPGVRTAPVRVVLWLLCGTVPVCAGANGEDSGEPPSDEPVIAAAEASESPDSTEDNQEVEEHIEEILVIGTYRRSLRESLSEKRNATEIIEALSAEDIGQLPDTSVAESLARLPGLSFTRNIFGANNVSIRGLGAVLTSGTLNDRDLASEWGDRSVPFNLFPAELISRASVYKAPSASHVEGGIGGTVDLRTARPLEWGARSLAINFRSRYTDLADELPDGESFGHRGSAAYVDQFADDTLGLALGYAGQYAPFVSADSYIYESRTVAYGGYIEGIPPGFGPTNDFNFPYGGEQSVYNGTSDRHSVLATFQWQPSETLEVNFDGFFSAFEQNNTSVGLFLGGLGSFANAYSDVQSDSFNLTGASVTCVLANVSACLERGYGQDLAVFNAADGQESTLQSYGLSLDWNRQQLALAADLAYSRSDGDDAYDTLSYRPYQGAPGSLAPVRPTASFGENDAGAAFVQSPLDFADPASARVDALRRIAGRRDDEIVSLKFDAGYELGAAPITRFSAGLRLVRRSNTLIRRNVALTPSGTAPAAILPEYVLGGFDQSEVDDVFASNPLFVLDVPGIRESQFGGVEPQLLPSSSHFIEEDVLAWYAQLDFETSVLGVPAFGNFGVRVVRTDVDTEGTSSIEGVEAPIATRDDYTEVLPSANINLALDEGFVVRLAGARVLARPPLNFLSPGTDTWGDRIFGGVGGGGNPYLRPYIATQFDLSFEKYFSPDSAFVVAVFYKDMESFITQETIQFGPPDNFIAYVPENGEGGGLLGIEATWQHTFAGLLPDGYGSVSVYATYTYTDSKVELTETFNSSTFGLDGQSDHLANLTLSWYRNRLGVRVSYRYRSSFTRPQRPARAFTTNRAEADLSFQVSFDATERFRLLLEGWNLLNEPRDSYYGLKSQQGHYTIYGRSLQFGATWRM